MLEVPHETEICVQKAYWGTSLENEGERIWQRKSGCEMITKMTLVDSKESFGSRIVLHIFI